MKLLYFSCTYGKLKRVDQPDMLALIKYNIHLFDTFVNIFE